MKGIIARRYARALIRIGQEDGNYERYGQELKSFDEALSLSAELRAVMENPIYGKEHKKALFHALNSELGLSPTIVNFILLLIDKRRLGYFTEIVRIYGEMADEVAGRSRVKVTSAVSLSPQAVEAIRKKLASITGKEVILTLEIDPQLIGGVVTQIGGVIYDGSIRTQLENLRQSLMKG
mgnify:CR=1 FL=1